MQPFPGLGFFLIQLFSLFVDLCLMLGLDGLKLFIQLVNAGIHRRPRKCTCMQWHVWINLETHHHHHHLSPYCEGCWGTTDDLTTSFLHFSLFSTALWDLANSRPVHSLMLSSHFFCLPCLLPFSLCLAIWFWPDLMNERYDHTTAVCISLRWSGGLHVVRLPAGS